MECQNAYFKPEDFEAFYNEIRRSRIARTDPCCQNLTAWQVLPVSQRNPLEWPQRPTKNATKKLPEEFLEAQQIHELHFEPDIRREQDHSQVSRDQEELVLEQEKYSN